MIDLLPGINSTASALTAERIRMEVVSQNIANANVSNFKDGQPYVRQVVHFENVLNAQVGTGPESLQVARIAPDPRPPRRVYDPANPARDANGWVAMPNINPHEEMVDLIAAARAFEANLAVVKASRNLTLQTLSIGRRA